jgi:ubiquinone/menaquinone biosynthesis C-methylase UbiE
LACGNGKVIQDIRLKNSKLEIVGIDYNGDMIELAKSRVKDASFLEGDILELESLL